MAGGDDDDRIEGEEFAPGDAPLDTERLALDDEERLPWLESADDDYDGGEGGGTGRLIALAAAGLVVLAVLVWVIWWASRGETDPALVADGSTIEAPKTPYKEAPKDPGGRKMAGTGDTSFAVSEGQTRPARLGDGAPAPAADADGKAPAAGSVGVQVGAYSSQAGAEAAWAKMVQQHSALSGVGHRAVQGQADIGTVWRLQALASDSAAANALCAKLKAGGLSCQVK
ncbi:MAG: SPOR domain-containing protein [Novosphingobium sp.]